MTNIEKLTFNPMNLSRALSSSFDSTSESVDTHSATRDLTFISTLRGSVGGGGTELSLRLSFDESSPPAATRVVKETGRLVLDVAKNFNETSFLRAYLPVFTIKRVNHVN